jgi:hypothetical protein
MPGTNRANAEGNNVVDLGAARRGAGAARRPAPRNPRCEEQLCDAVARRLLVEVRYDAEVMPRLFAPHLVYLSPTGRINVGGTQVHNPGQPDDAFEPRLFEIGLIRTLRLTDTSFRPDPGFRPDEPRFKGRVICSV